MKNKKTIAYIVLVCWSLLTTIALAQISHYGITGIELLLPCVFAICVIVYNKTLMPVCMGDKAHTELLKKDIRYTIPIGSVIAVLSVIGSHIDMEDRVFTSPGIKDLLYIILIIPFFICIIHLLFFSSDVCIDKCADESISWRFFVLNMVVMLICWLPYYLTYFPGGIGNDDFECANMCLGNIPWTNHHPVFFTSILNIFIKVSGKNLNIAFGLFAFAQMLLLAATLSSVICWLNHRGKGRVFCGITLLAFSFHPIVAMYSIYVTKDVMFACFMVMLVLFLFDFCDAYGKKDRDIVLPVRRCVQLGVLLLLIMFSRNNGTMIAGVILCVMAVVFRQHWKKIIGTAIVVLLINAVYKGPVWDAMGIEKQSFVESASIPLSQIAYTIQKDGIISEENAEYLESIMPADRVKEEYEPGYTDTYKFSEYFKAEIIDNDPGKFIKVWFDMLPDNFGKYVEVYLMQTSGYWCYGISNTVATEGVQANELGITGTDVIENVTGISLKSILPKLVLVARKLPMLCMLSQMAVMILAVVLVCCVYIRHDNSLYVIAMLPLIVLWATIMIATPAHCLFRYMCPVFLLWPVLIGTVVGRSNIR